MLLTLLTTSSALTQQTLNEVFEAAVKAVMYPAQDPPPRLPPQPEPPVVAPVEFTDARFASLIDKKEFSDVTFRVQDKYGTIRLIHFHEAIALYLQTISISEKYMPTK